MKNIICRIASKISRIRLVDRLILDDAPKDFFGTVPWARQEQYGELFEQAKAVCYPEIDQIEKESGYAIDRDWMNDLAFHTQVVIKPESLNWQHGRIVYSTLRERIASGDISGTGGTDWFVLETGTARGFSACCMAKAFNDAGVLGKILTFDVIPHDARMIWNCIDDLDGKKTRNELLAPWQRERDRILFYQGSTVRHLRRFGMGRIHFAFLDAYHEKEDVLMEFGFIRNRQQPGDMVLFDDVTEGVFDGVVRALEEIEKDGLYSIRRIASSSKRGYAVAVRER